MEIIQNRKTMKIISVLILMIMLISTITPVFAATKTANTLELRDTSVTVKVGRKGKIRIKTNTTGKDVIWSSSDKKKTVIGTLYGYPSGYVEFEALDVGTATVTATAGGKKATCKVEVTEGSSLKLGDLFKGGEDDKKTPELPSGGGTGEALSNIISTTVTGFTTFITSEETKDFGKRIGEIITNLFNSIMSALSGLFSNIKQIELPKGTDLPAEATGGETGEKDNKTVEVTSVSISGANKVKVGETITLTATVKPSNATNKKVTWSSDSKAATVGKESGIVEGVTAGETVTITATTSNKITATYEVSVEAADSAPGGGGSTGGSSSTITITTSSVVKTDAANALPTLSREELLYIIENATITSTKNRRANLRAHIDDFMYIQNNNKVNALFAIAVSIEESEAGCSDRAKNINNWFGIKGSPSDTKGFKKYDSASDSIKHFGNLISGSTYFGSNKITPGAIGPVYCTGNAWGGTITSHMKSLYKTLNK